MKKRELAIVAAVLVPFALLVAAGFYFSAPTLPVPAERGEGRGEGRTSIDSGAPSVAVTRIAPLPDPLPAAQGEGNGVPAELRPLLPEVKRCFADQHLKTRHEVKVRYTPTPDGGFANVQVDEQNPYLAACLEDVFAELAWQPDGGQTFAPATHTFSFDPSPD